MELDKDTQEHYDFLEALRISGVTNMYRASPYLEEAFDLNEKESVKILMEWMDYKLEGN